MKEQTNRNNTGANLPAISITASLSEAALLKKLIERLAGMNKSNKITGEKFKLGWQAFQTSSIEAFVSGDLIISGNDVELSIPFVKSFFFTCINTGENGNFNLVWGQSLS